MFKINFNNEKYIIFQSKTSIKYFIRILVATIKNFVLASLTIITILNYFNIFVNIMGYVILFFTIICLVGATFYTFYQAKKMICHSEKVNEVDSIDIMINDNLLQNAERVSKKNADTKSGTVIVVPINNSFNFETSKERSVHDSLKKQLISRYQNLHPDLTENKAEISVTQYVQRLIDQCLYKAVKENPSIRLTDQQGNFLYDIEYKPKRIFYCFGTTIGISLSLSKEKNYLDDLRIIFYANSRKEYDRDSYTGDVNNHESVVTSIKNIWKCKNDMFIKETIIFPLVESGHSSALTKMQSFEAIIDNYILYSNFRDTNHLVISIPFKYVSGKKVDLVSCYEYIKSIHKILSFKSQINPKTCSSKLFLQWGNK